jgi:hypothetical protein
MKTKLDIKLLEKLNIQNLEIIKSEAELNLDDLSNSENIITNKSNSLFQILVVIFTTIIGYLVSQINSFCIESLLIQISIFLCLVFGFILFLLVKVIYPDKVALKGSCPNNLIKNYIFTKKSNKSQTKQILRNRIYSLNIAIESNKENLKNRVRLFDWANKSILIGLIIVLIYSAIYFFTIPS